MEGPLRSPNLVQNNLIADQFGDGVLLIGASPLIRNNQVLRNRKAGFRFSSVRGSSGETRTPAPLVEGNVVRDNGSDEAERDYYTSPAGLPGSATVDCAWRHDAAQIEPASGTPVR
jgi:hypothetical protein